MAQHQDDPELSPEQEAQVRRLLADARHTDPVPDAVVARLDRVLADLAGEPTRAATVVRLADRRRRAATMLVAAAACVAAVIGVGQIVSNTGDVDAASPTSDAAGGVEEQEGGLDESGSIPGGNSLTEGRATYDLSGRRMPFSLQADEFARDAAMLKSQATVVSGYAEGDQSTDAVGPEPARESLDRVGNRTVCDPGAWGRGSYLAVLYDDAEGWVVLRRPQGETQIADLFLCGSESVVRSVTLPYP